MPVLLASAALLFGACGVGGGGQKSPSGQPPGRTYADGVQQFSNAEMRNLLLPLGAVPVGLAPAGEYVLPNDEVAQFFPDPAGALRAMNESGRMQGAAVDYRLKSAPRASEQAVAVSSSVAWYRTVEGAQAVLNDPTMELVIHRFGLHTAEISIDKFAQGSRAFRGFRDGDGPELAAYLVLFRRENVIGAVVVVVPATTDDGGKLAVRLARRQAGDLSVPRRGAATPVITPSATAPATGRRSRYRRRVAR